MKRTAALAAVFALAFFSPVAPLTLMPRASAAEPITAIEGFRTARFGMDEVAVKAAIGEDFGLPESQITRQVHPTAKTVILSVRIPDLLPDTGTAEVNYVFGYQSHKLNQVNILWLEAKEPSLGQAAATLRDYFRALPLVPEKTVIDGKMPDGNVLAFRGVDKQGRMVLEIFQPARKEAEGTENSAPPLQTKPQAKTSAKSQAAKEKAAGATEAVPEAHDVLNLIYLETPGNPDVFKLKPGQF